jgi:DNA-binding NarL/FixJ family response regulator
MNSSMDTKNRKRNVEGHAYALPNDELSSREQEVCQLLVDGLQLKSIASKLGISIHTADTHARNAYSKLGVHDRVTLIHRFRTRMANLERRRQHASEFGSNSPCYDCSLADLANQIRGASLTG